MKKALTYIRYLLLFLLWEIGFTACSDELAEVGSADMTFVATLPDEASSRAYGDWVNTLLVGVFEVEGKSQLEQYAFPISAGESSIEVQLPLTKNQTYHLVFWAYCNGSEVYDVGNLSSIRMKTDKVGALRTLEEVEQMDAFFATVKDLEVVEHAFRKVELVRPLAQINVGRASGGAKSTFTVKAAPSTFHPLAETEAERVTDEAEFTWMYDASQTATFTVDEAEYTYLAMGYVFAPFTEVMKKDCRLELTEEGYEKEFPNVVLQAKYRTNLLGSFTETNE